MRYGIMLEISYKLNMADVPKEVCSPNYVADFAHNRGYNLTSEEIVWISDNY